MIRRILLLCLFPVNLFGLGVGDVNITAKEKNAELLVKKAVQFIAFHPLPKAIDVFLTDLSWRKGELAISIINRNGYLILDAQDSYNSWSKIDNFDQIKHKAKEGGGWIDYVKNNRIFTAYVEQVYKDNNLYIVLTGYFSYSAESKIKHIVANILDYYQENGLEQTIKSINETTFEPRGIFFPFLCDNSGRCLAYESHPQFVGQTIFQEKNEAEEPILERILETIQEIDQEGWVDSIWFNAYQKIFVRKLDDNHFVGASYHPNISQESAINLVARAKQYIRTNGPQEAFQEFAKTDSIFVEGYLEVVVFDMDGKVVVSPFRPQWLGVDMIDFKDDRGIEIFKLVIDKIKADNTAWVSFVERQQTWRIYAEKIETPEGDYIISSGYIAHNKEEAVKNLVSQALEFFANNKTVDGFNMIMEKNGPFTEGDLYLFVYDMEGNCLVNSSYYYLIWQNFINLQDQTGKFIIADIINAANLIDEGWLTFTVNNEQRRMLINHIYETIPSEEEGLEYYRSYVIGCAYYL